MTQQTAYAIPITYTNISHISTYTESIQHYAAELGIYKLMTEQNGLTGFADYFKSAASAVQSGMDAVNSAVSTVNNTVTTVTDGAISAATGALSAAKETATSAVSSVASTVGDKVSSVAGSMFSSGSSEGSSEPGFLDKAGAGFASIVSAGEGVLGAIQNLNPLAGFFKDEPIVCENLTTNDGVSACYYIDNSKNLDAYEIKDIHNNVVNGQLETVKTLFADSAAVVNSTAKFDDFEATSNDNPTTISETLTKRVETDLVFNMLGGMHFGMDLATIELESLMIYNTINGVKVDGGLY